MVNVIDIVGLVGAILGGTLSCDRRRRLTGCTAAIEYSVCSDGVYATNTADCDVELQGFELKLKGDFNPMASAEGALVTRLELHVNPDYVCRSPRLPLRRCRRSSLPARGIAAQSDMSDERLVEVAAYI